LDLRSDEPRNCGALRALLRDLTSVIDTLHTDSPGAVSLHSASLTITLVLNPQTFARIGRPQLRPHRLVDLPASPMTTSGRSGPAAPAIRCSVTRCSTSSTRC